MTHEQLTEADPTVSPPIDRPIVDLLPRYYEVYGTNPAYEVERSIPIDGHEVAWMRYHGIVKYDLTGEGREGQPYEGHELYCACKFAEGAGWEIDEKLGTPVGLLGGDGCDKKQAAIFLRHLELRREYRHRGMLGNLDKDTIESVKAIMIDLIRKQQAGEFLEGNRGAVFWGGHYYLQTVSEITNLSMQLIWQSARQLAREKCISLEGAVVQSYRKPYEAKTYVPEEASKPIFHHEKPDKIWALVPRPEEHNLDFNTVKITDENRRNVLGRCVVGLAHTRELAEARLKEAINHPRLSHERLYQQSFVEAGHHAGALAIIAYTARTSGQPEEWVVEGFLGDAVIPEVHQLSMDYPKTFGIDAADWATLNDKIDEWWPTTKS